MTCEQCKYHSYIANTHFCDSRNHKRRTVRISEEDAKKDIDCKWAESPGYVDRYAFCPNCGECKKDGRTIDEFIEDSKESEE